METEDVQDFISEVQQIDYLCSPSVIWGGTLGDVSPNSGAKLVCLNNRLRINPRSCLVYSFGIHNEWSFDIHARKYGCEVFAFDGHMQLRTKDYIEHIHFLS